MGKHPNRAKSLLPGEEEYLWQAGQLGTHTPRALSNSMWYLLSLHFGLRGRMEHYDMKVEDFIFKVDEKNVEYLTFSETAAKTRQGLLRKKERLIKPKMFATEGDRCPVAMYKEYIRRRPLNLQCSGPFYLAVIDNPATDTWYKVSKLGVNQIQNIMKTMKNNTPELKESNKRLTNHTARKSHVPKSEIIGITGHSNERGLDPYDSGDEAEQEVFSNILDNHKKASTSAIKKSRFNLLTSEEYRKFENCQSPRLPQEQPVMNFYNCNVKIGGHDNMASSSSTVQRRKRVIIESDSSQE